MEREPNGRALVELLEDNPEEEFASLVFVPGDLDHRALLHRDSNFSLSSPVAPETADFAVSGLCWLFGLHGGVVFGRLVERSYFRVQRWCRKLRVRLGLFGHVVARVLFVGALGERSVRVRAGRVCAAWFCLAVLAWLLVGLLVG